MTVTRGKRSSREWLQTTHYMRKDTKSQLDITTHLVAANRGYDGVTDASEIIPRAVDEWLTRHTTHIRKQLLESN